MPNLLCPTQGRASVMIQCAKIPSRQASSHGIGHVTWQQCLNRTSCNVSSAFVGILEIFIYFHHLSSILMWAALKDFRTASPYWAEMCFVAKLLAICATPQLIGKLCEDTPTKCEYQQQIGNAPSKTSNGWGYKYPDHPCMVYLPTFGIIWVFMG